MQLEIEALAKYRARAWEAELAHRALLSRLPRKPSFWRRWLGNGLLRMGGWLTSCGEWLTLREYTQGLSTINK